MTMQPTKWKTKREGYLNALNYLEDRRTGKVTSLKTSSPKINSAMCDGFEWHTAIGIAARPGSGKSVYKDQVIREAFECNPTLKFRSLDFDLEMMPMVSAIREFSSVLGQTYKYMCSAEVSMASNAKITREELEKCKEHAQRKLLMEGTKAKYPMDIIEAAPTVNEFEALVEEYFEYYKDPITGEYTKTLITIDHARLFRRAPFEGSENEMLYNMGMAVIRLKKRFPVIFIIFNHLNRNMDKAERLEEGRFGNYPLESDVLGADAFMQCCDVVIAIQRPGKLQMRFYGPNRYIIQDDMVLVFHFLKVRNGDVRMSFFYGEFHKMRIVEMETPMTAQKVVATKKESIKYVEPTKVDEKSNLEQNNLFMNETN